VLLAVLFERGLAIHGVRFGAIKRGEVTRAARARRSRGSPARQDGRSARIIFSGRHSADSSAAWR
jgi:hypothetical protein